MVIFSEAFHRLVFAVESPSHPWAGLTLQSRKEPWRLPAPGVDRLGKDGLMEKDDSFWKSRLSEPLNAWPGENSKSFNAEKKSFRAIK